MASSVSNPLLAITTTLTTTLTTVAAVSAGALPVLLDATAKSCLVVAVAAVAAVLQLRASAAVRHLIWGVALFACLLLPILSLAVPKWQVLPDWLGAILAEPAVAVAPVEVEPPKPRVATPPLDPRAVQPLQFPGANDIAAQLPPAQPVEIMSTIEPVVEIPAEEPAPARWPGVLLIVWAGGTVLLLCRILLSRLILQRVLRSAKQVHDGQVAAEVAAITKTLSLTRPIAVYTSSQRITPMTWGILRPRLLLPVEALNWDSRRRQTVLLHELAHIKNYDTVTHVLSQVVCAVYWINPLVWIAKWRMGIERERACDDLVLRTGTKASDYAQDLLSLLSQRQLPSGAVGMLRRCELEARLRAILSDRVNRAATSTRVVIAALLIGVLSTATLAMLQATDGKGKSGESEVAVGEGDGAEGTKTPDEPGTKKFVAEKVTVL
ncbi:MAG: M56 family metallopeptidase [Planctomycetota bacterium]|nr:M56 family metallopeptidase [Planctomycetota bacterium]